MFQTKDILCSGAQMTRQGLARPRRMLIIILAAWTAPQPAARARAPAQPAARAAAQLAAAEDADAANAANAAKTPKKNDVSVTITLFYSAAGAIGAEGVEQDVAGVAVAAAKHAVAKHGAAAAKHALTAIQNH